MQVYAEIERLLQQNFKPSYLSVLNESSQHRVPPGSESHFRVVIVSQIFIGKSRVQRQRMVSEALKHLMGRPIHALAQRTLTPEEWEAEGQDDRLSSPPCLGRNKP